MLEETGLPYEPHLVDITDNQSHTAEYLSLNPNGKIPAIIDPDGPGGKPLGLFESGAILIYLGEKSGRFLSVDPAIRFETIQWVFFQNAGMGPMFGQVGFFNKFAGKAYEDKRPLERYVNESKRLLGVLDKRLDGRDWIMGADYSIADISTLGWIRNLITFYEARDLVAYDALKNVPAWLDRGLARPAVQRGLEFRRRDRAGTGAGGGGSIGRTRRYALETMELHRGRLIDHIQLVVKDIAASKRFYKAIFEVLGVPVGGEAEDHIWCDELFISTADSEAALGELTGRHHLAFQAADRAMVDAFHKAALGAGGKDFGAPGERKYHPGYYGAFVLDPDGNNIEAVFHGEAKRSAPSVKVEF